MGPIGRAQITFALAAKAAGITEKQLRNWLDKAQIALEGDDERSEGQWRRFSLIDVVRLGIVGTLASYGVPVMQAAEIIGTRSKKDAATDAHRLEYSNRSIDERLRGFGNRVNLPRRAVDLALRGAVLLISTDTSEPYEVADTEYLVGSLRCRLGFDPDKNPSNDPNGFRPAPKPDTTDLRHFILIDVGQIASDVLARLDAADED